MESSLNHIILFDGVCNFCNGTVNYLLQKDKKQVFKFCSLQSDLGKKIIEEYALKNIDSILYLSNSQVYIKSSAVLQIAKQLGGIHSLLLIGYLIPAFIRNLLYDFIARNRYKWFGKSEFCRIPTANERARFIT